ncbi:MAG TPA: CobD/CbiB family cobalamin biosynthesis protein [Azospirillaceae bacterium]|nr:CobD/CbiB family cobalamin biosynthesis protein [Azospirillaceae bacterium]
MLLPLIGGTDALLLVLLALIVDAALGDSPLFDRFVFSPGRAAARASAWFDRRLNRIDRSDAVRQARGTLVLLAMAGGAFAIGYAAALAGRSMKLGFLIELLLVVRCLSVRWPYARLETVRAALASGGVEAGRAAVAPLTGRQLWSLDQHGVVRAALEGTAKALNQRLVAPLFWYALLGLPGLLTWTVVDALDATVGHPDPRHARFGRAAAVADDLMNWLPARLTALLLALAALFVPKVRPALAWRTAVRDAALHPSRNTGWPLAALAGALDLSLGGPRREGERVVKEPWIGQGRARALTGDLRRARALYAAASILTVLLLAGGTASVLALTAP